MKNYKFGVAYDGSRYKGWQRLGQGELTIQDLLEEKISTVLGYKVKIHGSGRTDAGVHANEQIANMKLPFLLYEDFVAKINEVLPEDIRILHVQQVNGNFHARYSATGKLYKYYVDTKEKPEVFKRKYVYHFPYELDVSVMKNAAEYLNGKQDFSSFTDDKAMDKDKVRTIYDIQIKEKKGIIVFSYDGDGFLQHMVRILTGTLLEVGQGKIKPEEIPVILEKKERAAAGFIVPAKGLFLDKVYYSEK